MTAWRDRRRPDAAWLRMLDIGPEERSALKEIVSDAASGSALAMEHLARWSSAAGLEDDARSWWERAGAAGHSEADTAIGFLAWQDRRFGEAEERWHRAIAGGSIRARFLLGRHLVRTRSDVPGGTELLAQAADGHDRDALVAFGILKARAGNLGIAGRAWYDAAERASTAGRVNLVSLLARGEVEGAKFLSHMSARSEIFPSFADAIGEGKISGYLACSALARYQERPDESRTLLQAALTLLGPNADAEYLLGRRADRPPFEPLFMDLSATQMELGPGNDQVFGVTGDEI